MGIQFSLRIWVFVALGLMILAVYEAPSLTYVGLRTGLFDRISREALGVNVKLEKGWSISPFSAWDLLLSDESQISEIHWLPLDVLLPWEMADAVTMARIKNSSISGDALRTVHAREIEIGGKKFLAVSKPAGKGLTIAYAPALGVELRARSARLFSESIELIE